MKLRSLIAVALLCLTTSSFAQWFPARVNVVVLPGVVSAEVFNPFFQPLICQGQVFGQTTFGAVFNSYFIEQFLPVGTSRFAFVQTNAFAPFINGWANIFCRYPGFFF